MINFSRHRLVHISPLRLDPGHRHLGRDRARNRILRRRRRSQRLRLAKGDWAK